MDRERNKRVLVADGFVLDGGTHHFLSNTKISRTFHIYSALEILVLWKTLQIFIINFIVRVIVPLWTYDLSE